MATEMYRLAISLPKDMEERVINMRKRDEFMRSSISEIVRTLINQGLQTYEHDNEQDATA